MVKKMASSHDTLTDCSASGGPKGGGVDGGYGHFFIKKTFHRPTYCHHCTDMLWGLIGQGYVCEGALIIWDFLGVC